MTTAALAIRLYYKPMVMLIWLGAVVMMLGGALSLSDRRLRVGAPKPAATIGDAGGGVKYMRRFAIGAVLFTLAWTGSSLAVQPDEMLKDPALEARARTLSGELRCLVCQNQSIDDSEAPLARDLRLLVRERLTQGDSDTQVLDFLVSRYGQFVLLETSPGIADDFFMGLAAGRSNRGHDWTFDCGAPLSKAGY